MIPYWILFAIYAAGSIEYRRRGLVGSGANPLLLVAALFTALMIGFRFHVGGDWGSYGRMFEMTRWMSFGDAMLFGDPGYGVLNWFATHTGLGIWFVNLVCGSIFCWGLVKFAQRQPNPWLAILVGVPYLIIVVAMGYTRQGVAIGFVLAGLAALDRTSLLRFSIYILCAVAFHKSAIILLPVVALAASRNRILTVALLLVLMVMLYVQFVQGAMGQLVNNYVEAQYQSQGAWVRAAMNTPPAILYLVYQKFFGLEPAQQKLWRNFAIAALFTLVVLLFTNATTAVDRLALYLIPLQMFVFSRLPEVFRGQARSNSQVTLAIILYSAVIQGVWLNFGNNAYYWLPYRVYPLFEPVYDVTLDPASI